MDKLTAIITIVFLILIFLLYILTIIIKLKKAIKNKNIIAFLAESQMEKGETKNENISIWCRYAR